MLHTGIIELCMLFLCVVVCMKHESIESSCGICYIELRERNGMCRVKPRRYGLEGSEKFMITG